MANKSCTACEDLREISPGLILNGLDDDMCLSLANNTGLSTSDDNDDCTDLNNLNDCFVGGMVDELESYNVCDWKKFMSKYIPNDWTVNKAIICSICGIWTLLECTYSALSKLTNFLASSTGGTAFVRYFRNNGEGGSDYWHHDPQEGDSHTIDIYMDASGDSAGSQAADRDYIVFISNCTNFRHFRELQVLVTFYASDDTRSIATIRDKQGLHAAFNQPSGNIDIQTFSWTTSSAVLVKKGAHIKVNSYVGYSGAQGNEMAYRLHQYVLTWIPANVSQSLDPSSILTC